MMSFFKRLMRNQSGNTLILTAAAMPMLIGSAGLATDTVQWALWKRQLQKAADSAAVAGVYARISGQNVVNAVNYDVGYPNQQNASGPNNNRTGLTLLAAPTVNAAAVPPVACVQCNFAVSVSMQVQKALPFSSMFMSVAPTITANATAAAVPTGEFCADARVNRNVTGISAGGNVTLNLSCGMMTESTSLDAAVAFGSSSVKASPVAAVGGLDTTDNWGSGTVLMPYSPAIPDPFADKNVPAIPQNCTDIDVNPNKTEAYGSATAGVVTCFSNFSVRGTVNLQPGTYVITGDVNFNSQSVVNCAGCTFVLTNANPINTGTVTINGGAQLNLTPPDTGDYKGILFYSDRGADPTKINKINGNSASSFAGAFYFSHQKVEFTGNSSITYQCVKLIAWQLTFLGNSRIMNNCPNWYDDRFQGRNVRLVA